MNGMFYDVYSFDLGLAKQGWNIPGLNDTINGGFVCIERDSSPNWIQLANLMGNIL